MEMEEIVFTIIAHSGDAKSSSLEAIQLAKKGNSGDAKQLIKKAEEKLIMAHREQTKLIQREAQGLPVEINLLIIHAQDHLMNAMTVKELANEMIDIYDRITE